MFVVLLGSWGSEQNRQLYNTSVKSTSGGSRSTETGSTHCEVKRSRVQSSPQRNEAPELDVLQSEGSRAAACSLKAPDTSLVSVFSMCLCTLESPIPSKKILEQQRIVGKEGVSVVELRTVEQQ